mmetsp:Transcript_15945/g.34445  ORF Transcript_15945/g.34445 Transcript_15945/m.34445 type:complete len:454 (-) Transcript_15945:734-2095(-)
MDKPLIKTAFKTPEGRYTLQAEKAGTIQFNYERSTRLTLATLQGGPEDGSWIVYNVGDVMNFVRHDVIHKEPTRSLLFNANPTRGGFPTCHAFAPARDGVDLVVGLGDGSVLLCSVRAQLQLPPQSNKPNITSTLTPEASAEVSKCTAVAWLPRNDGNLFAAAFASGSIYLYKKSTVLGEGGSKFSLNIGSSSKSTNPLSSFTINGGGINDLAASPDATRLAAACKDGVLRLLDVATGTVVGGFTTYYGAMLCCTFSPDGKFVAAGGEDDLIGVYGVQERFPVAHCEGHKSWISRVAFDPSAQLVYGAPGVSGVYRLGSVGQDAQLCLWDVQAPGEGDLPGAVAIPMRKSGSQASLQSPLRPVASAPEAGASSTQPGHQRKPSVGKTNGYGITPSLPHADMNLYQPTMEHRLHAEPLSDILFTEETVYTADHTGSLKMWARPRSRANGGMAEQ